jgi:hypothetical protein
LWCKIIAMKTKAFIISVLLFLITCFAKCQTKKIDTIHSKNNVRICYDHDTIYIVDGVKVDSASHGISIVAGIPYIDYFIVNESDYFSWDNFERVRGYGARPITNNYNLAPPFAPVSQRY